MLCYSKFIVSDTKYFYRDITSGVTLELIQYYPPVTKILSLYCIVVTKLQSEQVTPSFEGIMSNKI